MKKELMTHERCESTENGGHAWKAGKTTLTPHALLSRYEKRIIEACYFGELYVLYGGLHYQLRHRNQRARK